MSGGKYWSFGVLRGRGWDGTLCRELLPKPEIRYYNGKKVRLWERETVLAAEQLPAFQEHGRELTAAAETVEEPKAAESPNAETETVSPEAETAFAEEKRPKLQPVPQPAPGAPRGSALRREELRSFLNECMTLSLEPENEAQKLARYYHRGILLSVGAVPAGLREGKAQGYVGAFFAMENHAPTGENSPATELKRFAAAAGKLAPSGRLPQERIREHYTATLLATAERELAQFREKQPEADIGALLAMPDFPVRELMSRTLGYVYSVIYVPRAIQNSLELLVALNPKDEYPEARAMRRHFIVHIGGTNTGKTYAGFQRLARVETGVYLAPLRLLALEAQETLLDMGVNCSLTTGEEEDVRSCDTHVAATAEKLDMKRRFSVAVIDECQMIADRERGYAWTRAILGVLAEEIHLCAAPEAKDLLLRIIKSCGDTWEVMEHERKTPLLCMRRPVDYLDIQPGDALITFSKVGVLSVAEDLRAHGKEPAIIYGALPYATRRKQVAGFLEGESKYLVSTDAIGMGLNLPIRRIIFMDTEKFDGFERRSLKPEEVKQIAGRAGRFGIYDKGYVGATENLPLIQHAMETEVPPLTYAVAGFSDLVLSVDFDLLEVLEVWNRLPTPEPYRKLDISRYITMISAMREQGFRLSKTEELAAANIPFDEKDDELMMLFFRFLRLQKGGNAPEQPVLQEKKTAYTLPELELYYRKLDLYFSFCKAFSCPVDSEALRDEREKTADMINMILVHNLKNNIRFCARCGAAMPMKRSGRLCGDCAGRMRRQFARH